MTKMPDSISDIQVGPTRTAGEILAADGPNWFEISMARRVVAWAKWALAHFPDVNRRLSVFAEEVARLIADDPAPPG